MALDCIAPLQYSYSLKIPEIASMEAYNVRMLAISQNSYLLLDDAEVLTYKIVVTVSMKRSLNTAIITFQ